MSPSLVVHGVTPPEIVDLIETYKLRQLFIRGRRRRLNLRVARLSLLIGALLLVFVATAQAQAAMLTPVVYVVRIAAPDSWETIYHEVERCVGKDGDYRSVEWYVANQKMMGSHGGQTLGLWRATDDVRRIVVVGRDTALVRHEALHDVLWLNGFRAKRTAADSLSTDPEHPMPPFDKCAKRAFP